jgi:hypothetical protein
MLRTLPRRRGGGVRCIYLHWLGTRVLLAPGARSILWELGLSNILVCETWGGLQELEPGGLLVHRARGGLRVLGPTFRFRSWGGIWEVGPNYLLIS